ncbi:MAG: glycerol-3-phosphate dehydrogenase C-terminal domain-containing protein [Acidimicrobiales bacterium]
MTRSRRSTSSIALVERLLWRHGSRIADVLAIAGERNELREVLPGGGYLAAEVVHAARHEGALHLDDVLARRVRISFETEARGTEVAAPCGTDGRRARLGPRADRSRGPHQAGGSPPSRPTTPPTTSRPMRACRLAVDARGPLGA